MSNNGKPELKPLPEGVETEIVIQKLKNGNIVVIAPDVPADTVRAYLLQSFVNINEDICTNRAFGLLVDYLDNVDKQKQILGHIRGSKLN